MGIKTALDELTPTERKTLALFYQTPAYEALRKLIDAERIELAKDHVDQTEITHVRYLSGQAEGLRKLVGTLTNNYKQSNKNEESTRKQLKKKS